MPLSPNTKLYDQDFYAWTQTTRRPLIRAGKWNDLDREALAEEIESVGKATTGNWGESAGHACDASTAVALSARRAPGNSAAHDPDTAVRCAVSLQPQPPARGRKRHTGSYAKVRLDAGDATRLR